MLAHLIVFAVIVLIPALLFSAFLILQFSRQQQEIVSAQVVDTAEVVSNAIDRELYGMITTGRVLASSPALARGSLGGFRERTLAALAASRTTAELIDADLDVVISTAGAATPTGLTLDDTATIQAAFETRRPEISGVIFAESTGEFVFHVAVPVIEETRVSYVLVLQKPVDVLGSVIADRNLPQEWSAIIKDRQNRRVFAAVTSDGQVKSHEGVSYDNPSIVETLGERRSDHFEGSIVSSLSGWVTTVAVPTEVIVRPALRSWILLVSAGLLLVAFSIMLGIVFGRRIATPIRKLSHQAEAIGQGRPANIIQTNIAEIGEVSMVLAQASRDRREAEEQTRFLMREMTHRAKNQYALIAAIARRAAKESSNTTQLLATLSEALNSLARSADLLAGRGWESVDITDLVQAQLKPFGASGGQISVRGPKLWLNPTAAQTVGLALHELATNAAKYGSLSVSEGTVLVRWSLDDEFTMEWREANGPPVVEPKRSGFGTLVIQKMTARGLGGQVELDYAESGLVWKLVVPRETILAE
ncbi:MAG TPA: HWE histidine kinase domain-containing protein [Aurantimonas sp.]|nr:HWE histidine kinase domain-containing protein [Aurantimonas sp.]